MNPAGGTAIVPDIMGYSLITLDPPPHPRPVGSSLPRYQGCYGLSCQGCGARSYSKVHGRWRCDYCGRHIRQQLTLNDGSRYRLKSR